MAATPFGQRVLEAGEIHVRAQPKLGIAEEHRPEAPALIRAFLGRAASDLGRLLGQYDDDYHLSLHESASDIRLCLVFRSGILADAELGPVPSEYWIGMGATTAAVKAGFLPVAEVVA